VADRLAGGLLPGDRLIGDIPEGGGLRHSGEPEIRTPPGERRRLVEDVGRRVESGGQEGVAGEEEGGESEEEGDPPWHAGDEAARQPEGQSRGAEVDGEESQDEEHRGRIISARRS
jgi:hypothetical protein